MNCTNIFFANVKVKVSWLVLSLIIEKEGDMVSQEVLKFLMPLNHGLAFWSENPDFLKTAVFSLMVMTARVCLLTWPGRSRFGYEQMPNLLPVKWL